MVMLNFTELSDISLSLLVLLIVSVASLFFYYSGITKQRNGVAGKIVPPGSLGLPVIGESWSFLNARWEDCGREWFMSRESAYGPIFKTSIFGSLIVVVTGREGNKFVFSATDDVLSVLQPAHIVRIAGKHNIFELTGARYKLLKGAVMAFLKPESLQAYVGQMDTLVKTQLITKAKDGDTIFAVAFMKRITFNLTCTLLFGLHDEPMKEALFQDFLQIFKGLWALPFNLPGTVYYRALQARARIEKTVLPILESKRKQLSEGKISEKDDLISSFLSLTDENNEPLEDEVIIDNVVTLMIASHDTSAILMSLMVWKLSRDPEIYKKVLEEHMSILNQREEGTQGKLTWSELQKMKYTWRVAQELMRIIPPVSGNFRKAVKDIKFGGYDIPKGWQVFWEASGTHMDKDIFEDPKEFNPSRFENPSKPIPPFAYIPFGSGPRMCIGNEFARVETLVVIHNLIKAFDWYQLCPDEKITRQPFPYPSKGLPIKLKARGAESCSDSLNS